MVKAHKGQPAQEPHFGVDVSYMESNPAVQAKKLVLKHYDDTNYGYLRITVDKKHLQIGFYQVGKSSLPQARADVVTIDLASHAAVAN